MEKRIAHIGCLLTSLSFVLLSANIASAQSASQASTELQVLIVKVIASDRQIASMSSELLSTAVVDGHLLYLVATDGRQSFAAGIPPELILGLLRDPSKGITKANLVKSLPFFQNVWRIAGNYMDDDLKISIVNSEAKASVLIDARAPDPMASISKLREDIIGIYKMENETISFYPNQDYQAITENGVLKLTPFLMKALFASK